MPNTTDKTQMQQTRQTGSPAASNEVEEIDSSALFASAREIVIRHGMERYRLRLTKLNRLILTK